MAKLEGEGKTADAKTVGTERKPKKAKANGESNGIIDATAGVKKLKKRSKDGTSGIDAAETSAISRGADGKHIKKKRKVEASDGNADEHPSWKASKLAKVS